MISGPKIIEDIVDEMWRRLQADCYLPPHMVHHNFSLYGCLELTVTLTRDDRPSVVTECWIRMGSANNGRGTEAAYPEPLAATELRCQRQDGPYRYRLLQICRAWTDCERAFPDVPGAVKTSFSSFQAWVVPSVLAFE